MRGVPTTVPSFPSTHLGQALILLVPCAPLCRQLRHQHGILGLHLPCILPLQRRLLLSMVRSCLGGGCLVAQRSCFLPQLVALLSELTHR
jgi:hypothetical protein